MKKYLVGGAVRDSILKLPIIERDWIVIGATPEEMLSHGYQQVGKDFPVFLHPESREEYALARTEKKIGKGYTSFVCHTSSETTLEEDLYRRDLTINAIARDDQGTLIDPYNGQYDISHRYLRHISDAFSDDPLRVLRVARFAAQFYHLNFRIVPETLELMIKMTDELSFLSSERIWKETEKALATKDPDIYFKVLHHCNALKILFPEIDSLFGLTKKTKLNAKLDTGIYTLITLSIVSRLSEDIAVRFATLFCNICTNLTTYKLSKYHYSNNGLGVKVVESLCLRLKVPNIFRDLAIIIVKYKYILHMAEELTPKQLIKLFCEIDIWRRPERLEQVIMVSKADAYAYWYIGLENKKYSQENFLREAFIIANSVKVDEVITSGFKGKNIREEINKRRIDAIYKWKNATL